MARTIYEGPIANRWNSRLNRPLRRVIGGGDKGAMAAGCRQASTEHGPGPWHHSSARQASHRAEGRGIQRPWAGKASATPAIWAAVMPAAAMRVEAPAISSTAQPASNAA